MSSLESAARFRDLYMSRLAARNYRLIVDTAARARAFREVLLDHVGYVPRMPRDVHQRVVDDWGSCCLRSVLRGLSRLYADGKVERVDGGYRRRR